MTKPNDDAVDVSALNRALDAGQVDVVAHWLQLLLMKTGHESTKCKNTLRLRRLKTLRNAVEQMLRDCDEYKEGKEGLTLRPGLASRSANASCELSYSQLQMFALQRLQPSSTAYNVVRVLYFRDQALNSFALRNTCHALMAKHETLRTCFDVDTELGGQARQVVHPLSHFQGHLKVFNVIECEALASNSKEAVLLPKLAAFVAKAIDKPFDMAHQAPIRVVAFTNPDQHVTSPWVLAVVLHHIVTDAASKEIFWRDFHQFYARFSRSIDATTSATDFIQLLETKSSSVSRLTYRDFSVWQRSRMRSGVTAPLLQYWLQLLTDGSVPVLLELPFDAAQSEDDMSDKPNAPKATTTRGDVMVFQSSPALQKAFSRLCHAQGASIFMGLLAVFYMLIERLSGQQDFIIGVPSAGRQAAELHDVMGYFVNTLPLRIGAKCTGSEDFKGFLACVREVVLGAYNHSEIPFHQVLEHLRSSARSDYEADERRWQHPLFQVMFSWEADTNRPSMNEYVEMTLPHQSAKFDLMLSMRYHHLTDGTADCVLEGSMEYPTARFTQDTVKRFTDYYLKLLEQVTTTPTALVRSPSISMLSDIERKQLVSIWGTPKHSVASDIPFLDECLFSQVQKTPDNTALRFEVTQWTYQDLWYYSGLIRDALCMLDIPSTSTELHIGLLLDRGLENVAAMVGVLRSKAVFVPLDPEHPRERLRFMARDSRLQVIITERKHDKIATDLSTSIGNDDNLLPRILCYEDMNASISQTNKFSRDSEYLNKDSRLLAENSRHSHTRAAYILYTSGSTGNPKGVVVPHAALMTTLWWTVRTYAVTSSDVFLQSTSTTLDGSLSQLFSPLLVGGSARITRPKGLHDLQYMRSVLLQDSHITFCVFVPSYFALMMDFLTDQGDSFPSSIRHIVLAGEAFPIELARQFYKKHKESGTCLVNEYGPTEASITSTAFQLSQDLVLQRNSPTFRGLQSVPIGKPIDGHPVVVLDRQKRLVPVGVPGELYIGGAGVARGYWHRSDLTKHAFIPHKTLAELSPFPQKCTERWYKTGDLVKWLPSGDLLFLGRTDTQVKRHGMRIEVEEVRNVLLRHFSVKAAEVLVVPQLQPPRLKHQQNSSILVAFVILIDSFNDQENKVQLPDKLRSYLRQHVPIHMVPQSIQVVHCWPRTPNGKIDLRTLASCANATLNSVGEPKQKTSNGTTITVQLATDILRQVWMQALGIDDLTHDGDPNTDQPKKCLMSRSFFELGGDSLAAIRAIALAQARGIALSLEQFFCSSSLSEMAKSVAASIVDLRQWTSETLIPLNWPSTKSSAGMPTLFMFHDADGTVWKLLELARQLPFAVIGVQAAPSRDDNYDADKAQLSTVEGLAQMYWDTIREQQRKGPYYLGGFSFGCRVAYEVARLAVQDGHQILPLILLDGLPFEMPLSRQGLTKVQRMEAQLQVEEYASRAFHDLLLRPLGINYRKFCRMENMYHPYTFEEVKAALSKPDESIWLRADLYMTRHWQADVAQYRPLGIDITTVATLSDCTHLTMLRPPTVEHISRHIRLRSMTRMERKPFP